MFRNSFTFRSFPSLLLIGLAACLTLLPTTSTEACGGSRSGFCTWLSIPTGGPQTSSQSTVHGSTWASVETIAPNEMHAEWVSGKLFGYLPGHGNFVMGYQESRPSFVEITSNQESGIPFFPATARQTLHYYLDIVDEDGTVVRRLENLDPMIMVGTISSIPPYGSLFETNENVTFYDTSVFPPEPTVILQLGAQGSFSNAGGYNVQLVNYEVDEANNTFTTTWEIGVSQAAQLDKPATASTPTRWFATGIYGVEFDDSQASRHPIARGSSEAAGDLSLEGPQRVTLTGTFDPNQPRAGVAVHAIGHEREGHMVFSFFKGSEGLTQIAAR